MRIVVQRNGKEFGPYTVEVTRQYLAQGTLLAKDLARLEGDPASTWSTLAQLLRQAIPPSGLANPFSQTLQQLKAFDWRLLFPWVKMASKSSVQDRRLLGLATIGLTPLVALALPYDIRFGYWAVALYFSVLWALFFFSVFRTPQVSPRLCVLCFFFTGMISIACLLAIQQIQPWAMLYAMTQSANLLPRFTGMFLGVGIHEELCKAAILFLLVKRTSIALLPQTVVLYGIISGLGFGIYEGVHYQTTLNRQQVVDTAYFLNIMRLTSLPFLHAIWSGIAGYFIGFAALFPAKRNALWVMAILIPAFLHGLYDTVELNLMGLAAAGSGVLLLKGYLANCQRFQQHLSLP
jgi:RsiW-degrading membrane proteinase PrsW (M82 family)